MSSADPLLSIEDLKTWFYTDDGVARAVDGVSYAIRPGETLGVVGESGCGKSVTAMSILQLVPTPPGKYVGGKIMFKGENLLDKEEAEMRKIRGKEISVIFQEPMTSLNPVFRVGDQIGESLRLHEGMSRAEARERSIELLRQVGIPSPEQRIDEYPHQLSGGMKQRVMIAIALACNPALLIADEPTTALDVTIQAQILELLRGLQKEKGMAILMITHDLGVVAENADHVVVMYAGKVVESAPVEELFENPKHPYTVGLFRSLPRLDQESDRLEVIEGNVPNPLQFPTGCKFRPRCLHASETCAETEPKLDQAGDHHLVSCHHWEEVFKASGNGAV
ncbi:MAG: peptide ABC transporter ATP-binding protein [Planctomycetes bacterium]|nr:peptide ABC transporter ATP-binding protein [Planctomycetota bacterium]